VRADDTAGTSRHRVPCSSRSEGSKHVSTTRRAPTVPSSWKVNSAPVPLERVKTEMKNLGVQLDNLCQFLPQAGGLLIPALD
jgi:hypothetical protein